jgi:sec-independent protein translocase protein TatB
MFDIGWSDLLVIAVVAIVVIGPKELPRLMRTFGHYTGKVRRAAAEFQRQFEEAVRETEIDEVRKAIHDFRDSSQSLNVNTTIDTPLMTSSPPKPAAPPSSLAVASATPSNQPKPARKPAAKTAAARKRVPAKKKKAAPKAAKRKGKAP